MIPMPHGDPKQVVSMCHAMRRAHVAAAAAATAATPMTTTATTTTTTATPTIASRGFYLNDSLAGQMN